MCLLQVFREWQAQALEAAADELDEQDVDARAAALLLVKSKPTEANSTDSF
jgi:hypothetical protein